MKKIITLTVFLVLVTFPAIAMAAEGMPAGTIEGGSGGTTGEGISTIEGLLGIVKKITDYFFTALVVFAVIFIVLAGFSFLTASGEPEKLNKAKNQLLWALIGVAIGALAKGAVNIVCRLMDIECP
jgi:hypothetical protein